MSGTEKRLNEIQEAEELYYEAKEFYADLEGVNINVIASMTARFTQNKLRQERERIADLAEQVRRAML